MSIKTSIENKLHSGLDPCFLEVVNESYMHSVPPNSETHFKVVIASERFVSLRQVQRHQKVYALLADELAGPVHALALHTYTEDEWSLQKTAPASPNCHGGSKKQ